MRYSQAMHFWQSRRFFINQTYHNKEPKAGNLSAVSCFYLGTTNQKQPFESWNQRNLQLLARIVCTHDSKSLIEPWRFNKFKGKQKKCNANMSVQWAPNLSSAKVQGLEQPLWVSSWSFQSEMCSWSFKKIYGKYTDCFAVASWLLVCQVCLRHFEIPFEHESKVHKTSENHICISFFCNALVIKCGCNDVWLIRWIYPCKSPKIGVD